MGDIVLIGSFINEIAKNAEKIKAEIKDICWQSVTPSSKSIDYLNIRREAADIANFAAMIIYACDKEKGE